jgi:hypothetical protein
MLRKTHNNYITEIQKFKIQNSDLFDRERPANFIYGSMPQP